MTRSPRAVCFTRPGLGHLRPHVHDGGDGLDARGGTDPGDVVDTVLKAHQQGTLREMRQKASRRTFRVGGLHGKKRDFGARGSSHYRVGFDRDGPRGRRRSRSSSPLARRASKLTPAPDEHDRRSGESELSAEVAADRAGADDRDPGPIAHFKCFSKKAWTRLHASVAAATSWTSLRVSLKNPWSTPG